MSGKRSWFSKQSSPARPVAPATVAVPHTAPKPPKPEPADPAVLRRRIEERAYQLWVEEGCIDGRDIHYWLRAEEEILGRRRI